MITISEPMLAALAAADHAAGRTSPNPPVGAALVREGAVIATGWTQPPGGPHAEIVALRAAGAAAAGADLFVTLEPCTIHGRTPPCTAAIIAAGVRRVVVAARDPNPRFAQDAATVLGAAGIAVEFEAPARPRAEQQTEAFRRWITTQRPFVTAKYAMTLDGKIASHTGDARWITGPAARRRVHVLRDELDAILVGVGTLLADDPLLTTRLADHWRPVQHPLRVVLDSQGRTPPGAAMLQPEVPGHTLIVTTAAASAAWHASHTQAEIVVLPAAAGRIDLLALLDYLGQRDITSLLVEGGSAVLGAFVDARLLDRLLVWIAPKLLGGASAPSPVGGLGIAHMADAWQLMPQRVEAVADDLLITAYPVIQ